MADFAIRPYRAADRAGVRRVCHQTGYMGEPADWFWRDARSFADLFSAYYTDSEPGSAFVVESDGEVAGFLLGCVRSADATPVPSVMMRTIVTRGLLVRPGTAGFLWRTVLDLARDRDVPPDSLDDPRWPSHLHIDLLPEARGRGLGGRLVHAWLSRLRELGSPGCHLGTFAENTNAIGFFERMGFARHGPPRIVPGFRLRQGGRMHVQFLVQSLEGDPR